MLTVTGTAGGNGWTVKYRDAAHADITAQVTGARVDHSVARTPAPALSCILSFSPIPLPDPNTACITHVTAGASLNPQALDMVTMTTRLDARPDLAVSLNGTMYTGDNIYNTDGADQEIVRAGHE